MNRPEVAPPRSWRFPPHEEAVLGNGLRVWHFHLPGQHLSTFQLVLPVSLGDEDPGLEGVGSVALHAIDEGTRRHPDGRIGELLELHGAVLHGSARYHYTTLGGQAPTRRLRDVMPLFVEILTDSLYAPADVALHIESAVAGHESRLASPAHANRLALATALFGEHRSGRPASGTPSTLSRITPEDVRAWYREHFTPDGATLIVAGSGGLDDVVDALAAWPAAARTRRSYVPAPRLPAATVIVDRPDAVQTNLTLATRTITRDDPRWPALRVASHAMVGAFASRLNVEIRERLGYSYGIGGGVAPGVTEGQFTVSGSVRTEVTGHSLARLLHGLALEDGFTHEEVIDARNYLVGIAPLANETSHDIAGQATALVAAGLTPSYLDDHFAKIQEVSAGDATAAYRDLISPEGLTIALTGIAEDLMQALDSVGRPSHVVRLD